MEKGFFEFKAEIYYGGEMFTEKGVAYAETFTEAMALVEDYYGLELCSISMAGLEPNPVYILEGDTKLESVLFKKGE